ncbi:MAG: methyltransferase domain-containing protein [Acidobacteriota bacterium]|nr:methyltransferase domain-containing protein [Acidobacteriota bacterium]
MKFTGERFIPGQGGCQIAYEHLHRYFFALRWAEGRTVLDLASGSGYGSALLARRARHVWALDLDAEAVREASRSWRRPNLTFLRGDALQLPFQSGSMDLVVAMEILEHLEDQTSLIHEAARVCSATGTVLVSTPNKAEYSDARHYKNPFHRRELYRDEFIGLLKEHFPFVDIVGQQIRAGSLIAGGSSSSLCEVFEEAACGADSDISQPMYYLAVCSPNSPHAAVPLRSAFLDSTDGLLLELKREIARLGEWGISLEDVVGEKDRTIRDIQARMEQEVDARDRSIRDLQDSLAREVSSRDQIIEELQDKLAAEVGLRDQTIRGLQEELRIEVSGRDERIVDLLNLLHMKEKEFDERGKWALSLQNEVEKLTRNQQTFLYRILANIGLLPK